MASCANNHEGVRGIYDVKERQMTKPLAICVADPPDVARYGHTEVGAVGLNLRRGCKNREFCK